MLNFFIEFVSKDRQFNNTFQSINWKIWCFDILSSVAGSIKPGKNELKDKLGHKTLKAMTLATGLFDINEELTDKGGIRVLYRLKPDQSNTPK